MALDSATYVPAGAATDAPYIVGVRGPYMYKLNATTGARISSFVFNPRLLNGPSCVAYDPVTQTILAGGIFIADIYQSGGSNYYGAQTIQRINPVTWAANPLAPYVAVTDYLVDTLIGAGNSPLDGDPVDFCAGVLQILPQGGSVWFGYRYANGTGTKSSLGGICYSKVPASLATFSYINAIVAPRINSYCVVNEKAYGCDVYNWSITAYDMGTAPHGSSYGTMDFFTAFGGPVWPIAIEFSPDGGVNGALYFTATDSTVFNDGSKIHKVNPVAALGSLPYIGAINHGVAAFNGVAIKRNPYTGLLYAAGGGSNAVVVINPSLGDAVTVKTSFDFPIGFCFTPTKTFAIQAGSKGLLQVT